MEVASPDAPCRQRRGAGLDAPGYRSGPGRFGRPCLTRACHTGCVWRLQRPGFLGGRRAARSPAWEEPGECGAEGWRATFCLQLRGWGRAALPYRPLGEQVGGSSVARLTVPRRLVATVASAPLRVV